ncbi:MAG: GntR family transcriptional regulator [Aggregatilineales bacterium]
MVLNKLFADYKINRDRPVPYHVQVYDALERITTSQLKPGDQLPSEPRLCELFGVSRTVIRRALEQLDRDGLIVRIMGKGTFVAEPKIHQALIGPLIGFYESMVAQGYTPTSKVLQQERIEADAKLARWLRLQTGDPIIFISRLRYVSDVPLQLVDTFLPYSLCAPALHEDFTRQSLYAFLRNVCGLHIATGKRMIEAVLATEEEASLLEIDPGAPLILLESISYLENGTPLEYYRAVHRSDRTRFEVNLLHTEDGGKM